MSRALYCSFSAMSLLDMIRLQATLCSFMCRTTSKAVRSLIHPRSDVVARPGCGARGRRCGEAGLVHDTAEGLTHDVVRGASDVIGMAILAVGADVRNHQLRIDLPYRGVVESPFRIGPGLRTF